MHGQRSRATQFFISISMITIFLLPFLKQVISAKFYLSANSFIEIKSSLYTLQQDTPAYPLVISYKPMPSWHNKVKKMKTRTSTLKQSIFTCVLHNLNHMYITCLFLQNEFVVSSKTNHKLDQILFRQF